MPPTEDSGFGVLKPPQAATLRRHHVTRAFYNRLLEEQGHRCAICRRGAPQVTRLVFDFDHLTGELRGLLCGPCNTVVSRNSQARLDRLLRYVAYPPARAVREELYGHARDRAARQVALTTLMRRLVEDPKLLEKLSKDSPGGS